MELTQALTSRGGARKRILDILILLYWSEQDIPGIKGIKTRSFCVFAQKVLVSLHGIELCDVAISV